MFELLLFILDTNIVKQAAEAGVNGFIVDLENKGKQDRQANFDTQINSANFDDLLLVRQSTDRTVICRINGFGPWTNTEIDAAIHAGVDEILLPMVRRPEEVARTLEMIHGRCGLGILVETWEAVQCSAELEQFPLARVYVGLNDLAISRGLDNIFRSISDGTVEQVRQHFHRSFGFGGLTLPDRGAPIPCRLLINELVRMDCRFSFLRRSFYRDIAGLEMRLEIPRLQQAIEDSRLRSAEVMEADRQELLRAIAHSAPGFKVP
jgi:hypothetical protein